MDGLDDFLETEATPVEAATPEPEAETPKEERPRDEHGRFAPKTGVEPEPEAEQPPEPETVPPTKDKLPQEDYKAIREEREKRQRLESELEALKQQINSQQNPPEPPPSLWEDEQGWQQHFGAQVAQQAAFNAKLDTSEMLARQGNEDFDDMKARFLDMANQNPAIVQQCLSDPHPWAKAYTIAKNAAKMEQLAATDVADLEAKLREQITAELQAQKPAQPTLPTSLADAQSARTGGAQPFTPPSLDDILRR